MRILLLTLCLGLTMRAARTLYSGAQRKCWPTELRLSRIIEKHAGQKHGEAMRRRFLNRKYQKTQTHAHAHQRLANELDIELQLTPPEERMVSLLQATVKERNLQSTLRVAGGWVRDKLLEHMERMESPDPHREPQPVGADIDIAIDNMVGMEFAAHVVAQVNVERNERLHVHIVRRNPEKSKHLETAKVKVDDFSIDFVNLRKETYATDSRTPTMEMGTPYEDAIRRDLTINTLFYNLETRKVEDFLGIGFKDLQNGVINTPLAPVNTLSDDPLRVLRAIRFTARLKFKFAERLFKAATDPDVQEALLRKVSIERVGHEIERIAQATGDGAGRKPETLPANSEAALALNGSASEQLTVDEKKTLERLTQATSIRLEEGEGCGRLVTGVELLHRLGILRRLFNFDAIYVPSSEKVLSMEDPLWTRLSDAILGCVEGLDALLRAPGETPESRVWRANAGADEDTLRRVMYTILCVPFHDKDGPMAEALPTDVGDGSGQLVVEPSLEKFELKGVYKVDLLCGSDRDSRRKNSEVADVGVFLLTKLLKRGKKEGQLAEVCALGATSVALRALLDNGKTLDRLNTALVLKEVGDAWPISLLAGGALRTSRLRSEGMSLEEAAASVSRNLDVAVQQMALECLVPTVTQKLANDHGERSDWTSPPPLGYQSGLGMIPWIEAPLLSGTELMKEFGVLGLTLGRVLNWQLQWQLQNPLLGERTKTQVEERVEELRRLLPSVIDRAVAQEGVLQ